jgi:hypothetical protein
VSTLTEIAAGLADRLRTIAAFDQNVLTVVRRPAVYPAAIIVPPAIASYGAALDGQGGEFVIPVLVLVGATEAEGQGSLFPFLDWAGSSSIPAAVNADRKLGGLDVEARVRSAEGPGLMELPDGTVAYGVQLNVGILAS